MELKEKLLAESVAMYGVCDSNTRQVSAAEIGCSPTQSDQLLALRYRSLRGPRRRTKHTDHPGELPGARAVRRTARRLFISCWTTSGMTYCP